ncbi:MAG TPA: diaminopimelate epimerase [Candidatus Angelobacter sp.]|jgi:diaminopimelate epimerase|nr:diaminopimelate epimerase [Candidatus Angelobacter sp.]
MEIPFTKASACGNDFLIVDGACAPADLSEFTRRICDRHNGVGADGVEFLFPAQDADLHARLINADGTEAEISGNGTRCVAAYVVERGGNGRLTVRTGAGIKHCDLVARNQNCFEFEMDMGMPQVGDDFSITVASGEFRGTPVSMGNPHYVVFVEEFPSDWQQQGAEIGRDPRFLQGVNVEFVRVRSKSEIEVRFYERGVGETQSSGTGSCASAVASIARGHASSPLQVHAPGGSQVVRWTQGNVFLRGPAQLICRGEFLA